MDYRFDLQALGGVEGGADGATPASGRRDFKESLLAEAYAWRHATTAPASVFRAALRAHAGESRAPPPRTRPRRAAPRCARWASSSSPLAPAAAASNVVVAKVGTGSRPPPLLCGRSPRAVVDARAHARTGARRGHQR